MRKTEYRDVSGAEALRLMSNGEETESLEAENKWRRFRLKKSKGDPASGDLDQPSKLMYHKKGEWRECPYALEQITHREWRTRRKLAVQIYVTRILKDDDTGILNADLTLVSLKDFSEGARVRVTIQELDDS